MRSRPPERRAGSSVAAVAVVAALLATGLLLAGCGPASQPAAPEVVHVPADAPTISEAVDRVAPGGLVVVAPGTYLETVVIDTPGITLRGTDRNAVVIDGEARRPHGVQVIADGVRIQNLSVVNHTFNGVLITGMHDENGAVAHNLDGYERLDPEEFPPLRRFEVSYVTASNNGLYGIYAFNARDGVIADTYTSGSADAGIYVGQCEQCGILVERNVAENNAIGYENANASDSVVVVGNRFSGNRVGLTLLSWYQEAFLPQRGAVVVGNLIADNAEPESPAHVAGAFGIGIGLSGAQDNVLERNLIAGNPSTGVQVTNTEDIASTRNRVVDNTFDDNGVDVADVSSARAPAEICISGSPDATVLPAGLAQSCGEAMAGVDATALPALEVPRGTSFLRVPAGPAQPNWPGTLDEVPDELPGRVTMPDLTVVTTPDRTLLQDRAR